MNYFKIANYNGNNHYEIKNRDFRDNSCSTFEIPNDITFDNNRSPRLTFIKCKFDDFTINPNSYYTTNSFTLRFEECSFENFSNQHHNIYEQVANREFIGEYLYINIIKCFIKSELKIENVNSLSFHNSFVKTVQLINIKELNITIGNNYFNKNNPEYIVELTKYENLLDFNTFHITNCIDISISSTEKCKGYLKEIKDLNSFIITMQKLVEGQKVSIKGFVFKSLEIQGTFNHDFDIQNSSVQNLIFDTYSNSKKSLLYNINNIDKSESLISIKNSDLNQVTFDNFFFNSFNKILLFRNSFENVKFIGCDFPESLNEFDKFLTIENINKPDEKDTNYNKVRYETFLQLKNAVEKSGNYYEANKLKAVSDEALKNVKTLPIGDKMILCLNNFTNLHGQSFGKTFAVFIFSTSFLYFIYLKSIGVYMQIFTEFDMYLVKNYFSFIDITHKTDFLNYKGNLLYENTLISLLIDYISKIWIAYLIYQFIAAFRKYAKK